MYEAQNSIYCYEGTHTLVNKLNIKDAKKLDEYEASIVSLKLMALAKKGITGNFDVQHFVSIHKFLFEDIYNFAGEQRTVNLSKENFRFAPLMYLETALEATI